MSLFRTIFAFGNGREMPNLVLVFPECLRSASTLASLPEAKKNTRQHDSRNTTQTRGRFFVIVVFSPRHSANSAWFALCTRLIENVLWHICLLDFLKSRWMASFFTIRAKTILQHSPLVLTYSVLRRNMFRSRHDQPILTSLRLSYISRPTCHRHSIGKPYYCTLFLSETAHFCNYHIPNSRIVVGTGHRSTIFIFGIIGTS